MNIAGLNEPVHVTISRIARNSSLSRMKISFKMAKFYKLKNVLFKSESGKFLQPSRTRAKKIDKSIIKLYYGLNIQNSDKVIMQFWPKTVISTIPFKISSLKLREPDESKQIQEVTAPTTKIKPSWQRNKKDSSRTQSS